MIDRKDYKDSLRAEVLATAAAAPNPDAWTRVVVAGWGIEDVREMEQDGLIGILCDEHGHLGRSTGHVREFYVRLTEQGRAQVAKFVKLRPQGVHGPGAGGEHAG